ncbi:MAG: alpha/beta hydrolase [Burkholderiales bacterium]|nr:alpha/beta hydrolase [Burkholderiales bacterium]
MSSPITEHVTRAGAHVQFHLACGPADGPLLVFVHGWPELGWSWRHQLPVFGALGFRAVAPDLRGHGRSSVYADPADYAQSKVVADMLALLDALGRERAVWVGHDWGAPTVWSLAAHHPERCAAAAGLCVPQGTLERGLEALLPLIDRTLYPEQSFPFGQWDYMRFYEESFDAACASMDANVTNTVRALFRAGDPARLGKPAGTAFTRKAGGWFGGAGMAPELPRDERVLSAQDESIYVAALTRNGFAGPNAYYLNHAANAAYAASAIDDGRLAMPTLLLHARFDTICQTLSSRLAEPMRERCADFSEAVIDSGHWMAQEKPVEVNAQLARWLATRVAGHWPGNC